MTKHFEAGVVDVQEAVLSGRSVPPQGPYGILLGDDRLHYHPVVIQDPTPTGLQILEAAGKVPAMDHVLYRVLADGLLEEVRLEETTDLRSHGVEKFLAFRTSVIYRFELNGHGFEWGAPYISGRTLKKLAEVEVTTHDAIEIRDGEERLVENKDLVDLVKPGLERFVTRLVDITIIVNTRARQVHQRRLGYWEVVRLGYPDAHPGPKVLYTVTYSHGPHQNPEGNLQDTQSVWIKERMQFHVTQTDQS